MLGTIELTLPRLIGNARNELNRSIGARSERQSEESFWDKQFQPGVMQA